MPKFYNPDQTSGDLVMSAISSGQYRDIPKNIVEGYTSQKVSQEDTLAAIKKTPVFDPSKGPQIDFGAGKQAMTKEQLQEILSAGSDPANAYKPEMSQATKISGAVQAADITTTGTATAPSTAPAYTTKTGQPADVSKLPFPDIGAKPEPLSPTLKSDVMAQHGLPDIQSNIDTIDKQIADLTAQESAGLAAAATAPVSSAVRSKLGTAAKSKVSAQLTALKAQRTELVRQQSEQNKAVSLYMSEAGKTYSQAVADWNKENEANKAAITAMDKVSTDEVKNAKVQAQTILNGLKPNQQLTPDQQNYIDQKMMEAYGPEFQGIESAGLSGVLYSHSVRGADGKSYLMTVHGNPDGTVSIKWTAPTSAAKTSQSADASQVEGYIKSRISGDPSRKDQFLSPQEWTAYKTEWVKAGHSATSFNTIFKKYQNPSDTYD